MSRCGWNEYKITFECARLICKTESAGHSSCLLWEWFNTCGRTQIRFLSVSTCYYQSRRLCERYLSSLGLWNLHFFKPPMNPHTLHTHTDAKHNQTVARVKVKAFWTCQKWAQEYRQNPARHHPVCDEGTHLPRLRCLENRLHSCPHKKVMHAAIDLKRRLGEWRTMGSLSASVTLFRALQTLHVITTCPQAAHFLLSPTVS